MELYIIRHGETAWNVERRFQGRSDIPLNEYGIELAEITSEALKDVEFDAIYASPLVRALKTAEIIKRDRNLEIITDERLLEMSFGACEGRPSAEIKDFLNTFFNDPVNFVPMEGGETYEDVVARAKDFIEDVIIPNAKTMNRILVVAHGALNRALMIHMNHQTIAEFWEGIFQKNCCVNIYEVDGNDFTCIQNGKIYYEEDNSNARHSWR